MRRSRTEPTLVEKALAQMPGFEKVYKTLEQQTALRGQSKSTLNNSKQFIQDNGFPAGKRLPLPGMW
jgi:hypothetical protein